MTKAEIDFKSVVAKARWLTPSGIALRENMSRWGKSVWNTNRGIRIRRQMAREIRLLYTETQNLAEELESTIAYN
jgi:hypothetical protein